THTRTRSSFFTSSTLFSSNILHHLSLFFFFFTDTPTTEIYTLSLHDALPISRTANPGHSHQWRTCARAAQEIQKRSSSRSVALRDRKSTRLNSSHVAISYAVFCLKKKKE